MKESEWKGSRGEHWRTIKTQPTSSQNKRFWWTFLIIKTKTHHHQNLSLLKDIYSSGYDRCICLYSQRRVTFLFKKGNILLDSNREIIKLFWLIPSTENWPFGVINSSCRLPNWPCDMLGWSFRKASLSGGNYDSKQAFRWRFSRPW